MAADEIVRQYECSDNEKPRRLYRVLYGDRLLTARREPNVPSEHEFVRIVQCHLDWYNRELTPFVSTFADRQHATNWANQRARGHRDVVVLELDPSLLGSIFRVRDLVEHHGVNTRIRENWYQDEYLVLHSIPGNSIVGEVAARDGNDEERDDLDLDESGDSESGDSESGDSESGDSESDDSESDVSESGDPDLDDMAQISTD